MYRFARFAALVLTCNLTLASSLHHGVLTQRSDEWKINTIPEVVQSKDKSVPVVLTGIRYYPDKIADRRVLGIVLLNRSSKQVNAVSLRWLITVGRDRIERKRIYQWRKLDSVKVALAGGQRQEIKIQTPEPDMTAEPFVEANRGEHIEINVGVGEVEFDDGSTWIEPEPTSVAASDERSPPIPQ